MADIRGTRCIMLIFILVLFFYLRFYIIIKIRCNNAQILEWSVLLLLSIIIYFFFEPENDVPEKFFVLNFRKIGKIISNKRS